MSSHPLPIAGRLAVLFLALFASAVSAQEQRVEVTRNGVATTLVLPEYKSQGVAYASLNDIMRQLGGSARVEGTLAAAELGGSRAEVGLNDVAVRGVATPFSLIHPVLAYQNDALIAMSDVARFVQGAYGGGTPQTPPAETEPVHPQEEAPLESVAPAAPPAAPMEASEGLESAAPMADALEDAPLESVALPTPAPAVAAVPRDGTVVLDPGHGGEDFGAVGATGLAEKEITLNIAASVARILGERFGVRTVLTRDEDVNRSQPERAGVIEQAGAALVVSIHAGAGLSPSASGPAVFAHRGSRSSGQGASSAESAGLLAQSVAAPSGAPVVHEVRLALMRGSNAPGVLVELGNLSNPEDEARMADPAHREQLAGALAAGINRALGRPEPAGAPQ